MTASTVFSTYTRVALTQLLGPMLIALSLLPTSLTALPCVDDRSISIHCGEAPSAVFDKQGNLWVAFVQDQFVYVSKSSDQGTSYSRPVKVNSVAEDAEHNGENRPKILVDTQSNILVSWTKKTSPRFTGEIRFSRSTDGGRTFQDPQTINDDELFTGHRFDSLFLTEGGQLYITWIDKRELVASQMQDKTYAGAAIYYAVSTDSGVSFSPNYRVSSNSCECCRIAIAPNGRDNITILWRQIFETDIRDHGIAILTPEGQVIANHRASYDDWHINACPHHGPTMIAADDSSDYHMSWFSAGALQRGIYYGRFSFNTKAPNSVALVDDQAGAGHPYLARHAGTVYLVWKGFDGANTQLNLIQSVDNGSTWSEPEKLLTTSEGSDHPLLVTHESGIFLSWHSSEHGYVFEPIASLVKRSLGSED